MEKTYSYEQIEEYIRDVAGYSQSEKQYEGALMLSQLLAKAKEWDEIEEMLKLGTIDYDKKGIIYFNDDYDKWCWQGFTDQYFPSLVAALSALVGGEKK